MSEQIIKKWTEAFNNADWETVASLYTDDTVGSDPTGATFTGKEAKELKLIDDIGSEKDALAWLRGKGELDETIKVKELLSKNDLKSMFDFTFLKKKFNYLNQNFYNGFFAIWMPGL